MTSNLRHINILQSPAAKTRKRRTTFSVSMLANIPDTLDQVAYQRGLSRSRLVEQIIQEYRSRCQLMI